jgi:ferric-dicitrate binding protein FerR (iron transport regulator)
MADDHDKETIEDGELQRVLRAAGRREQPSPETTQAVHEAVRGEWLAVVRQRRQQRYRLASALAASVLIAGFALWLVRPPAGPSEIVGSVARTTGGASVKHGFLRAAQALGEQQVLQIGEEVFTDPAGRAALTLRDGTSVRLDHDTRVEFADAQRLVVLAGAVYVDANVLGGRLRVDTPRGTVRHLGTQYEVRLLGDDIRIRVREGAIELTAQDQSAQRGRAGEELTVSAGGRVERSAISTYGADWDWTGSAAPTIAIDGRPLTEFLAWAGRELGREVVFRFPEDRTLADAVILNGTIDGLSPAQALEAVLETTQFRGEPRDGHLAIERKP